MQGHAGRAFTKLIKMDKEKDLLVIDPYIINIEDVRDAGVKNIIRVRRPGWGMGFAESCIQKRSKLSVIMEKLIRRHRREKSMDSEQSGTRP